MSDPTLPRAFLCRPRLTRYVENFQGRNPSGGAGLRITRAPGGSASLIPFYTPSQQSRAHGTAMTMTSRMDGEKSREWPV